jgi:terminase small subunit-like protein
MSYPHSNAEMEYETFLKEEQEKKRTSELELEQFSAHLRESTKKLEQAALQDQERAQNEQSEKLRKATLPYSEPIAQEICERISSGELLINVCNDEHMPTVRRVTQWLGENNDFAALHKESINDRLTIFEEEVIKIADDAAPEFWGEVQPRRH